MAHHMTSGKAHNKGKSLHPGGKFQYHGKGRVPMKQPKRTKRMMGRRGGVGRAY